MIKSFNISYIFNQFGNFILSFEAKQVEKLKKKKSFILYFQIKLVFFVLLPDELEFLV